MIRKNARLFGMMMVLALVLLAAVYFTRLARPAAPPARGDGLDNVPPLGQLPTQEQIENRPRPR